MTTDPLPDDGAAAPNPSPSGKPRRKRKKRLPAGKIPTWANSQYDLGKHLRPTRDRKIIQMALKRPGNPGREADGRYHVAKWNKYINDNFQSAQDFSEGDAFSAAGGKTRLEMDRLSLQNEKLQFELQVKRRDYTANSEIRNSVGAMIMNAKTLLLQIPSKLAPRIVGRTEVEAEVMMRREINEALTQLSLKPFESNGTSQPN